MANPNDPRALIREEERRREERMEGLKSVFDALYAYMHKIDGSVDPGEHQEHLWSSRRMGIAATHLETGRLFMEKHIEELR